MSESRQSHQIVVEAIQALVRNDVAGALECFTTDAVVIDFSDPSMQHRGHDAIVESIRGYRKLIPDLAIEVLDIVGSESRVSAELRLTGTSASGVPVDVQFCAYYTLRDSKISSEHVYLDSAHMSALG